MDTPRKGSRVTDTVHTTRQKKCLIGSMRNIRTCTNSALSGLKIYPVLAVLALKYHAEQIRTADAAHVRVSMYVLVQSRPGPESVPAIRSREAMIKDTVLYEYFFCSHSANSDALCTVTLRSPHFGKGSAVNRPNMLFAVLDMSFPPSPQPQLGEKTPSREQIYTGPARSAPFLYSSCSCQSATKQPGWTAPTQTRRATISKISPHPAQSVRTTATRMLS